MYYMRMSRVRYDLETYCSRAPVLEPSCLCLNSSSALDTWVTMACYLTSVNLKFLMQKVGLWWQHLSHGTFVRDEWASYALKNLELCRCQEAQTNVTSGQWSGSCNPSRYCSLPFWLLLCLLGILEQGKLSWGLESERRKLFQDLRRWSRLGNWCSLC